MRIGLFQRQPILQMVRRKLKGTEMDASEQLLRFEISQVLAELTPNYDVMLEGSIFHKGKTTKPVDLSREIAKRVLERLSSVHEKVRALKEEPPSASQSLLEQWGWERREASPDGYVLYGEYRRGPRRKKGMVRVSLKPSPSYAFHIEENGEWQEQCVNAPSVESGIILLSRGL